MSVRQVGLSFATILTKINLIRLASLRISASFLVIITLLFPSLALSDNFALLIGVGEYPTLKKTRWLIGPPNDVRLMKKLLLKREFPEENIETLTDGEKKEDLPTRANILRKLKHLSKKTSPGDFVYLHFSGHGARQPQQKSPDDIESDGLDEIFLPRDIGRWDKDIQRVTGAITDDEFREYIGAIRNRGAFVWAVFDTCHSGTMMRGISSKTLRYRQVSESDLGIPRQVARPSVAETSSDAKQIALSQNEKEGGYVAFYASQSHELAPEMRLPRKAESGEWHGLLSYTIAERLSDFSGETYQQTYERIVQRYAEMNLRSPSPLAEGTHLNATLFSQKQRPLLRQWPLVVDSKGMSIPVGKLSRIDKGSVFALVKQPQDVLDEAIGYVRVKGSDLFNSELESIEYEGKPIVNRQRLPKKPWARLVHSEIDLTLAVVLPARKGEMTAAEEHTLRMLDTMGESSDSRGIRITWLSAGEDADIQLEFSPKSEPSCSVNRLWLLASEGSLNCGVRNQTPSIDVTADISSVKTALMDRLQTMAKVMNLNRLASRLAPLPGSQRIEMSLIVDPKEGDKTHQLSPSLLSSLKPGDHIRFVASNKGRKPVDITVLFINSEYGIETVYPLAGELGRINPGSTGELFRGKINETTKGIESFIVIAVEASIGHPVMTFSYLAQESLPASRSGTLSDLERLFNTAGFGNSATRGRIGTIGRRAVITSYRWQVEGV
ncbi:MAG: caspase family protein [Candidatus Thiodiazotropha taylori]